MNYYRMILRVGGRTQSPFEKTSTSTSGALKLHEAPNSHVHADHLHTPQARAIQSIQDPSILTRDVVLYYLTYQNGSQLCIPLSFRVCHATLPRHSSPGTIVCIRMTVSAMSTRELRRNRHIACAALPRTRVKLPDISEARSFASLVTA